MILRGDAGMVIAADGMDGATKRLERMMWNDPATGVIRHADAGYEIAVECAKEKGLNLPGGGWDRQSSCVPLSLEAVVATPIAKSRIWAVSGLPGFGTDYAIAAVQPR